MNLNTLAATTAAEASTGGQILGSFTASGVALCIGAALVMGLRGSDTIKINNKKSVGAVAIVFGIVAVAAGGAWADLVNGVHDIPASAVEDGGAFGNLGAGATALFFALVTFGPRWKRMILPALFGITTAVAAGIAGGYWGIFSELIRTSILRAAGAE